MALSSSIAVEPEQIDSSIDSAISRDVDDVTKSVESPQKTCVSQGAKPKQNGHDKSRDEMLSFKVWKKKDDAEDAEDAFSDLAKSQSNEPSSEGVNDEQDSAHAMDRFSDEENRSSTETCSSGTSYESDEEMNEDKVMPPPILRWGVGQFIGYNQPHVGCSDCKTLRHAALLGHVPANIIGGNYDNS